MLAAGFAGPRPNTGGTYTVGDVTVYVLDEIVRIPFLEIMDLELVGLDCVDGCAHPAGGYYTVPEVPAP